MTARTNLAENLEPAPNLAGALINNLVVSFGLEFPVWVRASGCWQPQTTKTRDTKLCKALKPNPNSAPTRTLPPFPNKKNSRIDPLQTAYETIRKQPNTSFRECKATTP
ncbi:MAG: hypothetical protein P3M72_00095 [Candidatus Hodgkinia cicadicola]|nr:MAG: hypothetical protein P3M72_00095 [Candidatus Hodgkinia cicadicola]